MNNNQTDWKQVKQAALSTCCDPGKQKINSALVQILQRFEGPIGRYFARRLGCRHPGEQSQEIYAEFCAYIIQYRKKIFRQADPGSGKLQSYLYAIAWSFANRYLKKQRQAESLQEEMVGASLRENTPVEEIENQEQDEYARMIIGLTLASLKNHDCAKYELLTYKYFSRSQAPSAREIAVIFGILSQEQVSAEAATPAIIRGENTVHQRLTRARNTFFDLMEQQIRLTLQAFDIDDCTHEHLVAEKIAQCHPYLEKGRELVASDFPIALPERQPTTWSELLNNFRLRLIAYLDNCLRCCCSPDIAVDPQNLFEELLDHSFTPAKHEWYPAQQSYRQAYLCARKFISNYLRRNNLIQAETAAAIEQCHYALLVMELALIQMQRSYEDKYRLLLSRYFGEDKPSGYQLAIDCGLLAPSQSNDSSRIKKAQDIVYQRIKRAKQLFWLLICREIDVSAPLLTELWQPTVDNRQQAREVCRRYLQQGFPANVRPGVS